MINRDDINYLLEKAEEYTKGKETAFFADLARFIFWLEEGLPLEEKKED